MYPVFKQKLRPIAITILLFFTWFCIEPWNYAVWAQSPSNQPSAFSNQSSASKRFEEALKDIKQAIENLDQDLSSGKDITKTLESLKGYKKTLEAEDQEIKSEFSQTDAFLKEKGLPSAILDRHTKAASDYDSNFNQLKANLDSISRLDSEQKDAEKKKNKAQAKKKLDELKAKIKTTKDHLKEKVKEPPHTPLDPNNLPHRTPKIKARKPRLKKEEFAELQKPIQLAFNGDPSDLLLVQSTQDLPTAADLAETIEVQFTQEIKDLATSLNHNPVKIYNWVRNNIDFVPTYGSIQGANMCLLTKQCNDMDTASLLIALLRTSGISARYVMGTIEVPIDQVMNWVGGFTNSQAALDFISSGGTPVTSIISGGKISSAQIEHTWVEAYVDYIPSRGAVHKQGDTWIAMDGSYKQYTYSDPMDIPSSVGFDINAFVNEITAGSTIDTTTSSISNVPQALVVQRVQEYVLSVQQFFTTIQGKPFEEVFGAKNVIRKEFQILPATLSYKVITAGSKFSVVPGSSQHNITFEVASQSFLGPDFTYTASIPYLSGKRITLSYIPSSSSDEALIQQYGSIETTPPYLLNLKPQLKIEGQTVATGASVGSGQDIDFIMTFSAPDGTTDRVANVQTAGAYLAVGLDLQYIPKSYLEKRLSQLGAIGQGSDIDAKVGETLFLLSLLYFAEVDANTAFSAAFGKAVFSRFPSEAIMQETIKITFAFGVPFKAAFGGLAIDVDRDIYVPFGKDGDPNKAVVFMVSGGFHASSMEHAIFEQIYNIGGISAVKVMQLANAQGIPIFRIDKGNITTVLPLLQISSSTKQEIQDQVNAGNVVTVPKQEIQYFDWVGTAYISMNPETGAAGYIISGGYAGGFLTLLLDCLGSIAQFFDTLPLPLRTSLSVFLDVAAFVSTMFDISRANVDSSVKLEAGLDAVLSLIIGLAGVALLAGSGLGTPFAILLLVTISISEILLYVDIALLLEGKIPVIESNPFQRCENLL
ncbi:MAG: transglutaminase [Nitrospirae bacterium]|nr:transglutaminase [Nitrospirota bacterium]